MALHSLPLLRGLISIYLGLERPSGMGSPTFWCINIMEPEIPEGVEEVEGDVDFLQLLRESWELAAISQFCRIFSETLKIRPFSTDKLEAAILEPDEHGVFLSSLLYLLLRPAKETREPYIERESVVWEELLKRKLDAQWSQAFTAHPMAGGDFYTIDPVSRVRQLYLCAKIQANIT